MHNILIVDDDSAVRMTIGEMLKPLNCNILQAMDGKTAVEIVNTVDIDMVILDVLLPNMDGFTVASEIRRLDKGKNISIVMLSAVYTKMKYKNFAKDKGADAYIIKPVKMKDLLNQISKLLNITDFKFDSIIKGQSQKNCSYN